jgi:hypothetical protein
MHAIMTEGFATVAGKIIGNIHGYIMILSSGYSFNSQIIRRIQKEHIILAF